MELKLQTLGRNNSNMNAKKPNMNQKVSNMNAKEPNIDRIPKTKGIKNLK